MAYLVLEYLKVFLTWPVIIGVIFIVIIIIFKKQIEFLINRIESAEFGSYKIAITQYDLNKGILPTSPPVSTQSDQSSGKQQLIDAERETARIWEYRYLNYFFVPNTQIILDWLIAKGPIATSTYDAYLTPYVTSVNERNAILGALENHHLIYVNNNEISVTEKGQEYAGWSERKKVKRT